MRYYAGLDVSLKSTHICVIDEEGKTIWRGVSASHPEALGEALGSFKEGLVRAAIETGSTSPWLVSGLRALGFAAICVDARQAKPLLSTVINKTDRNDARGLAKLARVGLLHEVHVKSREAQQIRSALAGRHQLVGVATELKNTIRGLLKPFGGVVGAGAGEVFVRLVREQLSLLPAIMSATVEPIIAAWRAVRQELARITRQLLAIARRDATCKLLMTMPGVGALGALAFASTIDDPARFAHARSVGAHLGLTPRRSQSGEVDFNGRISRRGDALMRSFLYEGAGVMLFRWRGACALKDWAQRLCAKKGVQKARVALARKMGVVLFHMWKSGLAFHPKGCTVASTPA